MDNLLKLLFSCFALLFTSQSRSHLLKHYKDQVVGHSGVRTLPPSLVPTPVNGRRLIFIGDVHGCLEELKLLLKKAQFDKSTDHVIFVGDLVAKGPFSLDTISYVASLGSHASCVRGNHDDKLMQWNAYLSSKRTTSSFSTHDDLDSLIDDANLPDGLSRRDEHRFLAKHLDSKQVNYLESLPYVLRIPDLNGAEYLIVHAGLIPGTPPQDQKCWDVTNMRNIQGHTALDDRESGHGWFQKWETFESKKLKHASKKQQQQKKSKKGDGEGESKRTVVVYGHDAGRGLNVREFTKGLDSRCVRGGQMTALVMDGRGQEEYFQIDAKRRYD